MPATLFDFLFRAKVCTVRCCLLHLMMRLVGGRAVCADVFLARGGGAPGSQEGDGGETLCAGLDDAVLIN